MCLVLNERYGFSRRGFGGYVLNCFLRIHPPYWVACAATLAVMLAADPATTRSFWQPWEVPDSFGEWTRNLGIFGLRPGPSTRLVPAAWALHVELTTSQNSIVKTRRSPRPARAEPRVRVEPPEGRTSSVFCFTCVCP